MDKRILFIVEGERDSKYVTSIAKEMKLGIGVVPVRANIYMLYSKLKADEFNVNITDILLEMKDVSEEDKNTIKLYEPFLYTYLMFDMDPQDNDRPISYNIDIIREMLSHFSNETDNTIGKLYVNYPMLESLWDYNKDDIDDYKNRYVDITDVKGYKKMVGARGNPQNPSKYTLTTYKKLARMNVKKANFIERGAYEMPPYNYYLDQLGQSDILSAEEEIVIKKQKVGVLSSVPLFMVDYWGNANGFYDSLF